MYPTLRFIKFITARRHVRWVGLMLLSGVASILWLGLYPGGLTQAQGPLPPDVDGAPQVTTPLEITLSPQRQMVPLNDPASFTVRINNSGGSTLTDVSVSDPTAPDCDRVAGSLADLAPGEWLSYTCQSPPLAADLITDISAGANDAGTPVEASARAFVDINSTIKLNVQPPHQFAVLGQIVTFTIAITNLQTGQALTDFSVVAPNVPDCSRASGALPDLAASASLSYTCQIQMISHRVDNSVTAFAGGVMSPVDVDPPAMLASATAGAEVVYLPAILKAFVSGQDLVVDNLVATSSAITVTIRNRGTTAIMESFWVDVSFNPGRLPGLNRPWKTIAPAGAVWGVTQSLAPGASLTLISGGAYYFGPPDSSAAPFPSGVPVYVFVDSVNYNTNYGNVQESDEGNNLSGPVVSTASDSPLTTETNETPSRQGLPSRQ
jgi:uncharacterized repeat protein (TIGR01451 family)